MSTDFRRDPAYILQQDVIATFLPSVGREQWQVVYASRDSNPDRFGIYSALLPATAVAKLLAQESWNLSVGDGLPGFSESWPEGTRVTTYHRFGGLDDELRPLVIYRHFHGASPSHLEMCEEFRHFHDLAEDRERRTLLDFDTSGYPIGVARIEQRNAEVLLPYLLQFLAATRMHLAIFFDVIRYSLLPLESIPAHEHEVRHSDERSRYSRHVLTCDFIREYQTFSAPGQDHYSTSTDRALWQVAVQRASA